MFDERVPDESIALVFSFYSNLPENNIGLSEEEWAEEAVILGTDVKLAKIVYGKDAYKDTDGKIKTCTTGAIQMGLCGRKLSLSIEQRVQMAKQLLEASDKCEWIGFDKNYLAQAAYSLGAGDITLHVPARCTSS